jgi:hypothetical protein
MYNTYKLQQKICWLYDNWDSISCNRRDISLCHHSPPRRCRQKTTSKRWQLSTELHDVIKHKTTDINCNACMYTQAILNSGGREERERERESFQTSAGKFKFTAVDTTYAERQLNGSLFPVRLDPFVFENDDILAYDAVWFPKALTFQTNLSSLLCCRL